MCWLDIRLYAWLEPPKASTQLVSIVSTKYLLLRDKNHRLATGKQCSYWRGTSNEGGWRGDAEKEELKLL